MEKSPLFILLRGIAAAAFVLIVSFYTISVYVYVREFLDNIGLVVYENFIGTAIYFVVMVLELAIFIKALWWAVQGAAVITSITMPSSSSAGKERDNIDRITEYRNGKMQNMGNNEAAEFMRETMWLDSLNNGTYGSRTNEVKGYINSKFNSMSNETAIDWIRGGRI